MPEKFSQKPAPSPWWTGVFFAALVALAWSGLLDERSTDYIDAALVGSGAIYATARGINAIVSVLQGTEMNAFVITFTIGELLDPVNDLIERFSGVMLIALGSLALQKILLEVISHTTFNILLTALGAAALASALSGYPRSYRVLARYFLATVLIRFSLALVILANSWADAIFLADREVQQHAAMKGFHEELELIGSRAGLNTDPGGDIATIRADIERNEQAGLAEQRELESNRSRLQATESELEQLDRRSWWEKITGRSTADIQAKQGEIEALETAIAANEFTISALAESREALEDRLDCLQRRSRGDACNLADTMSRALAAMDVRDRIEALGKQVDAFSTNLINLLMSLLLKSVLLPILFLYILLRSVGSILQWGR